MRLLTPRDDGEFSLVQYFSDRIPRYAILSHTWGNDDQEVTYKDIVKGKGKTKAGYEKIRFCGKQAADDGLQHFWVDTCCIDKSNSTELSEAINSMFLWYHKAARCYVYLTDVFKNKPDDEIQVLQPTWYLAFQTSRWFSRGWTLQELLAPPSVEFFSADGQLLGDKRSLAQLVHQITGIPVQALLGSPLQFFSVDERLSWSKRRETKLDEDTIYSLLGIFDVHMPLLYGEGRQKAMRRLQREIRDSSEDILNHNNGLDCEEGTAYKFQYFIFILIL
jgi:hypothetical protein